MAGEKMRKILFLFSVVCFIFFPLCVFFLTFFRSFLLSVLSYFGTPYFSARPRALSHPLSTPVPPSIHLPLFTQLGLMERWPNDKNPGEQTHLDSPPVATRDTYSPATPLLSI